MSGKGSKRRPTNAELYNRNFERIFCKKGMNPTIQEPEEINHMIYDTDTNWRPADGGRAVPFEWGGKEYLLMQNLDTGEHAYYNATDDRFEDNVEMN